MPLNGIVLLSGLQVKDCLHSSTPILASPWDQRLLLLEASAAPALPRWKSLLVRSLGSCSFCSPHQQAYPAVCGGPIWGIKGFRLCVDTSICVAFLPQKTEDDWAILLSHKKMGVQWHLACQCGGILQNVKQLLISKAQWVLYNKH